MERASLCRFVNIQSPLIMPAFPVPDAFPHLLTGTILHPHPGLLPEGEGNSERSLNSYADLVPIIYSRELIITIRSRPWNLRIASSPAIFFRHSNSPALLMRLLYLILLIFSKIRKSVALGTCYITCRPKPRLSSFNHRSNTIRSGDRMEEIEACFSVGLYLTISQLYFLT